MSWRKRAERLRATAAPLLTGPIFLEGDAEELLELLRAGAFASEIAVTSSESAGVSSENPASIVILAIESDGRRSSIRKASKMLDAMQREVAPDAIRIVVVQSGRSRIAPARLQRLLANEILFEVTMAIPALRKRASWRSFRERVGLATLDAAGLQILRFG